MRHRSDPLPQSSADLIAIVNAAKQPSTFAPGFRFSLLDLFVLVAAAVGTWLVGRELWWAGMLIGFVVGHFFLFCNVFRISRGAELVWAGIFLVLAGTNIATDFPGWPVTFAATLITTIMLIAREMRQPWYHGIAWQRFNPNLCTWWEANRSLKLP
ncbi:hypothetical protein AYO49_02635 [Verrucomicrobiaceae bacterium SCGC AG-212-N21]|nr:hypothetical protein AYO49_02635 [Verrucomicrobiaceae bacterium SCGC AG-212-N21]